MKKVYIMLIVITICFFTISISIKGKKNLKINNVNEKIIDNTASKFNKNEEKDKIIIVNHNGEQKYITNEEDINIIKNIMLNLKFNEKTTDGMISYIITIDNDDYCISNEGRSILRENKEAFIKYDEYNKIIDIINKY